MVRRLILFLIICSGATLSSAQNVVIWKHILRISNDRYLPKGYIASKYRYCDTVLLYKMDYSDNGWQVYDSISYKKQNGLWHISYYDSDTNSRLYLRFSDTIENLHSNNDDIQYVSDKYHLLFSYLDGINRHMTRCNTESTHPLSKKIDDTYCYDFKDAEQSLLFSDYGIPMKETLKQYCCYVGKQGEYVWDRFIFSGYTIMRLFDYDKNGNLFKVTITRTHISTQNKVTWIESFFLTSLEQNSDG